MSLHTRMERTGPAVENFSKSIASVTWTFDNYSRKQEAVGKTNTIAHHCSLHSREFQPGCVFMFLNLGFLISFPLLLIDQRLLTGIAWDLRTWRCAAATWNVRDKANHKGKLNSPLGRDRPRRGRPWGSWGQAVGLVGLGPGPGLAVLLAASLPFSSLTCEI